MSKEVFREDACSYIVRTFISKVFAEIAGKSLWFLSAEPFWSERLDSQKNTWVHFSPGARHIMDIDISGKKMLIEYAYDLIHDHEVMGSTKKDVTTFVNAIIYYVLSDSDKVLNKRLMAHKRLLNMMKKNPDIDI